MTLVDEAEALRQCVRRLAAEPESDLAARFALRFPPPEKLGPYRRLRMAVGRMLRDLGLRSPRPLEPWLPGLKHLERGDEARPFVIWAVDVDRKVLREACRGFAPLLRACPDRVPVLVTNVADFSFFSRLGWLVEYLPALSSPADGYAERKKRYLAWRYRDAPILPVSAGLGLEEGMPIEELLVD